VRLERDWSEKEDGGQRGERIMEEREGERPTKRESEGTWSL